MGRYRSRSYSPPRRGKRCDDPRDSRSRRDRRSPAPSGLLVRNISLDVRSSLCVCVQLFRCLSIALSFCMPEDLRIPFERFGPIKDVYLPKDYYTGEPKGFGFVKFQYPKDAADAKEHLNYTVIGGREIRIVFAEENRKTPQEMRRSSHISVRGSYRRRSPTRSPRRRYHSYPRSPSPARSDLRRRRARDDYYSPRRSKSVSRSVSPRDGRSYRSKRNSPRHSRSISRFFSPRDERNCRADSRSPSQRMNGRSPPDARDREPSRSPNPRGKSQSPPEYRSRSYSPR